ncbi:hypothetical protein ABN056_18505 [Providencia vermicola]|uniref:hypothetical protein n=1 Tax=Providencia TaxID=586 RepID=UPI00234B2DBE|nr:MULTISPECIES: hypothetical protein [Providencia]ELR5144578.1 hypothetical protein [Providencia stuartii]WER23226.1 hypothetical protein P2E04_04985 [Providencia stuartii]WER27346.1 hypothetical protein P2E05_04990 [Providencia stuartii]WER31437.1 hypothetical protein P2E06_04990 [Providencia stuartii]
MKIYNPPHAGKLIIEILNKLNLSTTALAEKPGMTSSKNQKNTYINHDIIPLATEDSSITLGDISTFWLNTQKYYSE